MGQGFELPLRYPTNPVQRLRQPRNLRIPKRHHCFSRKRRLRIKIRRHRHASAAKIHKPQPQDLMPPDEPLTSLPQTERVSTLSTEGFLLSEATTLQPPVDATSLIPEHCTSQDEGFFDCELDYTDCEEFKANFENGRAYCPGDKYHFPIDDLQQEIEFAMHHIWETYSPVGQNLSLAPVNTQKLHNILDIGSGACNWVEAIADKFPHTAVTGVDLSAQEGAWLPNVRVLRDDVELPWPAQDKYEFIHSRDMILAIKDWDTLLRSAIQSLEPGGFIELQEIHYSPQSEDGSVHSTAQPLADFFSKIAEGLKALGVDLHAITLLAERMRAAGFINVTTNMSYIPISRNDTQSKTENDAATWMRTAISCGLQGTALGPLTRGLGWQREEVEVYLVDVRKCLRVGLQDTKLPMYIIHAQRPC
ncbi:hypothetical protein V490_07464 [Pseudogymnoascus sp. VKM F-3557]|nr:hypothetical protein V490_07464 [Pseudogymnoascus sp. VKM F-3557]